MTSKRTNSEIGSHHWLMTILGSISSKGEFLKDKIPNETTLQSWGKGIYEDARELIAYYDSFNKPKVSISFSGTDIKDKEAFAKSVIETHKEQIICPECNSLEEAEVQHTPLHYSYIHHCINCEYIIMESEWMEVPRLT